MNLLVESLAKLLLERSMTVSTAESCTGGLIGGAFTALSGSSQWYTGGVVSYANEAKMKLLGVSATTLEKFGAVSEECASEMVLGIQNSLESDGAIAVTGIAGPGGGSLEKPVGLVYIATVFNETVVVSRNLFPGDREEVRKKTVQTAIEQLLNQFQQ